MAVRILCALALLMVGFAHAPISFAKAPSADMSAYMLPDGSIPDLCEPLAGHSDNSGKTMVRHGCEACRISADAPLPAPSDLTGIPIIFRSVVVRSVRQDVIISRPMPPNARPRAPPHSVQTV